MIYEFLADGFEEVEALVPVDFLRRAGKTIFTVGVGSQTVRGTHNIRVRCDLTADDIELNDEVEGIILPGGMPGTLNLEDNRIVNEAIDFCYENSLMISAICAAPSILGHKGLLKNRNAVCFPGFEKDLDGANVMNDKLVCVTDGNIITAKGAVAAMEFAFAIIAYFYSEERADEIRKEVQCP